MRQVWRMGLPVVSAYVIFVLATPSLGVAPPADLEKSVQAKVEPSVVYLQFWTAGNANGSEVAGYGTGFVIADSKQRRWIHTAAHSLTAAGSKGQKKVESVWYRLPRQEKFVECGKMIVDEKYDLAALSPHPHYPLAVPPLRLHTGDLERRATLYAIGSATALRVDMYHGPLTDEPITVEQMARMRLLEPSAFKPFAADLTFLRHGIPIAPGYSGCPIVTGEAKVVGVQSSTLKDAAFVGFAVHHKHIHQFDWDRRPVNLAAVDLTHSDIEQVLAQTAARPVPFEAQPVPAADGDGLRPVKIKLGGVEVDAPFIHHGYVERDAKTVIEKYVQDKEWYIQEPFGGMRVLRLQELLDRTRLARISNPVLGFQMLAPKGYRYSAQATTNPDGLVVTFDPPPDRDVRKPYDWPLSVWVTVEPDLFTKGRADYLNKVNSGEFKLTDAEKANPALFAMARDRYVNAVVADVVDPRFALRDLEIGVKDSPEKFRGNPKAETFAHVMGGEGAWLRSNYLSVNGSLCHNVRIGSRDPLVIVVHFKYTKENANAFYRFDGVPWPTDHEYSIIASTVSTK